MVWKYDEDEKWKEQYTKEKYGKLDRFRFLVLVGPSRMGKTNMAINIFGPELTIYVNVQNAEEPNLAGYCFEQTKAILLDEMKPIMASSNKVLFQASISGVCLRESRCQQFADWDLFYQIAFIVCTNEWNLQDLAAEDRQWICENSVVVAIDSPCWLSGAV